MIVFFRCATTCKGTSSKSPTYLSGNKAEAIQSQDICFGMRWTPMLTRIKRFMQSYLLERSLSISVSTGIVYIHKPVLAVEKLHRGEGRTIGTDCRGRYILAFLRYKHRIRRRNGCSSLPAFPTVMCNVKHEELRI